MIEEIENYINGEDYPDEIPKRIMGLFEREHTDLLAEVKRLRIIEDRYNSIEQLHTEGFCKYDFGSDGVEGCWFCEEERLEREEG